MICLTTNDGFAKCNFALLVLKFSRRKLYIVGKNPMVFGERFKCCRYFFEAATRDEVRFIQVGNMKGLSLLGKCCCLSAGAFFEFDNHNSALIRFENWTIPLSFCALSTTGRYSTANGLFLMSCKSSTTVASSSI